MQGAMLLQMVNLAVNVSSLIMINVLSILIYQTELSIPISDGPNRRGYFNDSIDEPFNTHIDLRIKLEAILADGKLMQVTKQLLHPISIPHYCNLIPNLIPDNYVILMKLIPTPIPMESNPSISNLGFFSY